MGSPGRDEQEGPRGRAPSLRRRNRFATIPLRHAPTCRSLECPGWARVVELVPQHGRVVERAAIQGRPRSRDRSDRAAGHARGERPASLRECPMTRDPAAPRVVDVFAHRGRFFGVLQETERSQTGVMTIAPGADAGPEEQHEGDQIIYGVGGRPSCAPTRASAERDRGALSRFPGACATTCAPPARCRSSS